MYICSGIRGVPLGCMMRHWSMKRRWTTESFIILPYCLSHTQNGTVCKMLNVIIINTYSEDKLRSHRKSRLYYFLKFYVLFNFLNLLFLFLFFFWYAFLNITVLIQARSSYLSHSYFLLHIFFFWKETLILVQIE